MKIELETSRLTLKTLDKHSASKVLKYYKTNENFLEIYEAKRTAEFFTLSTQKEILKIEYDELKKVKQIRFFIFLKGNDEIIGSICFSNIIGGIFKSCMLGYKLHKDYLRQGYMTEALKKSIDYIFHTLKLHRIEASIMPKNEASLELIKKLGFTSEGYSPKYLKINGVWEDHIRYALINDEV